MFKIFLLLGLIPVLFLGLFVNRALAQQHFQANYSVNYDVASNGQTEVRQDVTFRNTTDQFYASKYSASIPGTRIENVEAFDRGGQLPINVAKEGNRTKIDVSFDDQIVGLDKEYSWTLKYSSPDYAQAQGKTWQVTVPRAPTLEAGDSYAMVLSVPIGFGDPTSIEPTPTKTIESGGKLRMSFDGGILRRSGILANFGSNQVFDFKISYDLDNSNLLPAIGRITIPANTNYQQVVIDKITPVPENVVLDPDGNYVAIYKVDRESSLKVLVEGKALLNLRPQSKNPPSLTDKEKSLYTKGDKYWDVDNPLIKTRLKEIFNGGEPADNRTKARLINDYVASFLNYDESRVDREDFERLGSLSALNNPDQSLCSEYADLFVTLARAAGVPARRLEGYAYTANTDVRPLSLGQTLLHAWAEYYDDEKGWVMVDPTWESANDGVDYFNQFDLNHIVMSTLGVDSDEPSAIGNVEVSFSDELIKTERQRTLSLSAPDEVLAGLPIVVKTKIYNSGNVLLDPSKLFVSLSGSGREKVDTFDVGSIPPFGWSEYESQFRSVNFWSGGETLVEATNGDQKLSKNVLVKPFFEYRAIFGLIVVVFLLMIGVYVGSLYLHLRSNKTSKKSKKF